jgi:hypothetical protein
MIVDTDNGRSPVSDGIGKHLPRVDKAVVEQTQRYGPVAQNFSRAIQGNTDKMLLPLVLYIRNLGKDIFGFCNMRFHTPRWQIAS